MILALRRMGRSANERQFPSALWKYEEDETPVALTSMEVDVNRSCGGRRIWVEGSKLTRLAGDYKKGSFPEQKTPAFVNEEGLLVESLSVGEGGSSVYAAAPSPS